MTNKEYDVMVRHLVVGLASNPAIAEKLLSNGIDGWRYADVIDLALGLAEETHSREKSRPVEVEDLGPR